MPPASPVPSIATRVRAATDKLGGPFAAGLTATVLFKKGVGLSGLTSRQIDNALAGYRVDERKKQADRKAKLEERRAAERGERVESSGLLNFKPRKMSQVMMMTKDVVIMVEQYERRFADVVRLLGVGRAYELLIKLQKSWEKQVGMARPDEEG